MDKAIRVRGNEAQDMTTELRRSVDNAYSHSATNAPYYYDTTLEKVIAMYYR